MTNIDETSYLVDVAGLKHNKRESPVVEIAIFVKTTLELQGR